MIGIDREKDLKIPGGASDNGSFTLEGDTGQVRHCFGIVKKDMWKYWNVAGCLNVLFLFTERRIFIELRLIW